MDELEFAKQAAELGGDILRKYFRQGIDVQHKGTVDLVTQADIETEHAIADAIAKQFPGHSVLGEESHDADVNSEHLWIVDPLDGTTNFAHNIAHFAVSIAYYRSGEPVCGVVYNPIDETWFTAQRGAGAFQNDERIHVTAAESLNDVCIACGFFYDRGVAMETTLHAIRDLFQQQIRGIRRMGTASLDLCFTANGSFGAFFEFELKPWDFAAGRLVVTEAGGQITTCGGDDVKLERTSMLASNGHLHGKILDVVSPHWNSLN